MYDEKMQHLALIIPHRTLNGNRDRKNSRNLIQQAITNSCQKNKGLKNV